MKESNENKKVGKTQKRELQMEKKKTQPGLQHTGLEIF